MFTACSNNDLFFDISLAQWSLHRAFFEGKLKTEDFAAKARKDFGLSGIEYVSQFFADKATDRNYLRELTIRANDHDVRNVLIMVDGEGELASPDEKRRQHAVENHIKWMDAADAMNCHSLRVNGHGTGTPEQLHEAMVKSLTALAEYGNKARVNVIVENHGYISSDAEWLVGVMNDVNHPRCGTLPDFGNFCLRRRDGDLWESPCVEQYDKYKGVKEMMPYAKGVSAKSYGFDEEGNETTIDYERMLAIVKEAGYTGYIGIEYEGEDPDEDAGIRKTIGLLKKAGAKV